MTHGLNKHGHQEGFHFKTRVLILGFLCAFATRAEAAVKPQPHAVVELQLGEPAIQAPSGYRGIFQHGCLWQGEVRLHGQKWLLGAFTHSQLEQGSPAWMLLQSVTGEGSVETNRSWIFSPATGLSLNGRCYRMDAAWEGTGSAERRKVAFFEEQPPLGELQIEGPDIQRLQFHGNWVVLVEKPGTAIRLPAGKYSLTQVTVGKSNNAAWFVSYLSQVTEVATNKTNVLRTGGPLTNRVAVTRQGRTLHLDYELLGPQGQAFRPDDLDRTPRFQVNRKGRTVHTGAFEFG